MMGIPALLPLQLNELAVDLNQLITSRVDVTSWHQTFYCADGVMGASQYNLPESGQYSYRVTVLTQGTVSRVYADGQYVYTVDAQPPDAARGEQLMASLQKSVEWGRALQHRQILPVGDALRMYPGCQMETF